MSDENHVPRHLGIIMDGNRRWAVEHGLRPMQGHEEGVETLKKIIRYSFDSGVEVLTAFVFSTENWKRSKTEVDFLMKLVMKMFKYELDEFIKEGCRIVVLGSRDRVSSSIQKAIDEAEERTRHHTKGTLAFCFNYSAEQELADAASQIAEAVRRGDSLGPLRNYLYHPEVPDLDLIIRTSGEHRLSGFMLPRANYAELAFVETHWPAFDTKKLQIVLDDYANRQRRFGA